MVLCNPSVLFFFFFFATGEPIKFDPNFRGPVQNRYSTSPPFTCITCANFFKMLILTEKHLYQRNVFPFNFIEKEGNIFSGLCLFFQFSKPNLPASEPYFYIDYAKCVMIFSRYICPIVDRLIIFLAIFMKTTLFIQPQRIQGVKSGLWLESNK